MPPKGSHHTEEAKLKMRGRTLTAEQRRRVSEGTIRTMAALPQELKDKIRNAPIGYQGYWDKHPYPEEEKERIRQVVLASEIALMRARLRWAREGSHYRLRA